VHVTIGGNTLRLRLTNEFGTEPLKINMVHLALSAGKGAIQPGTDRKVTFGGKDSITIPAGSIVLSDAVSLATPALSDLAVSIYFPAQQISVASFHAGANQVNYVQSGNQVDVTQLTAPVEIRSWYFLKGVDVEPKAKSVRAVVAFGDSITDGAFASMNTNSRWPDTLARRLEADPKTANIAVLNAGMGGNRVLRDGTGPSAVARFDHDVLEQPGVKYLIMLESINDIGHLARNNDPANFVTAEDLEAGLQQVVARAHEHNIKVFGATVTPYKGAGYYSETGEAVREAVNEWIRNSGVYDGVVDFDKAVRNPADLKALRPEYDCRDHLHPNDAGYKAMGEAIDLALFQ
jgi:lysophospholipase L1-like esterase